MTNKQKAVELFIYVPADRYKVKGLIAIPLDEIAYTMGYKPPFVSDDNTVDALRLKTGEYHGKN